MLIVEDDPSTATALRLILKRKGWEVTIAVSVAEGIERLTAAPQCVILDLMLPDGNGRAVFEKLRTLGLTSRVIVTTGSSNETELRAVRALQPAGVLRKPIELSELLNLMSESPGTH